MKRTKHYSKISEKLKSLSENEVNELLKSAHALHVGIDGKTFSVEVEGIKTFVKKIPLSELEILPENRFSTANLYQLPLFCQYGIGAPGFGSWRELYANQIATEWVLSNSCENFSLLYHWCLVKSPQAKALDDVELQKIDEHVRFWDGSEAVQKRYEAISNPVEEIVMFLEFMPQTLIHYIKSQFELGPDAFVQAIQFVECKIEETVSFMGSKGVLHFDAHFENIMTDGKRIYFNDFGLCLSLDFKLTQNEIEFFNHHRDYDRLRVATGISHAISVCVFKGGNWKDNLRGLLASNAGVLNPTISKLLRSYGPPALALLDFFQKLKVGPKNIPYPKDDLSKFLNSE